METNHNHSYLAGILDGEGCFCVKKRKVKTCYNYSSCIEVSNTCIGLIEWLYVTYGGRTDKKKVRKECKDQWRWQVSEKQMLEVIKNASPYLKIKRQQADLLIDLSETFKQPIVRDYHGRFLKPNKETLDLREEIFSKVRELNRKGKPKP